MNISRHQKELAFFGKITASVSHELNNVLSIINENSGLLDDLMYVVEQGKPFDKDRISKIAQNISAQIKRKKNIIKLLNRFAHRVDAQIINFDLNELLNDIINLSRRFASLKRVNLEITLTDSQTNITNSPFVLQHIVFLIIILALEFCDSKDTIFIQAKKNESGENIIITTPLIEENEDTKEKMEFISKLTKTISGEIKTEENENNTQLFKLLIPISIMELRECL